METNPSPSLIGLRGRLSVGVPWGPVSFAVPSNCDTSKRGEMSGYIHESDGSVLARSSRREVAFFDDDGTIRDRRGGKEIGFLDDDGTVRQRRYGQEVGFVDSDGTVRNRRYGPSLGKVEAPVHRNGALLLLLG